MIKINSHNKVFEEKYWNNIWKKIESRVYLNKQEFASMFPEALISDEVNKQFFEDIILMTPREAMEKYKSVKSYYWLIYLTSIDLQNVIKCERNRKRYRYIRKEYYERLCESVEISAISQAYLNERNIEETDIFRSNSQWKRYTQYLANRQLAKYDVLKKIFSYNIDIEKEVKVQIIQDLEIEVCPYCNRQYINVFIDNKDMRTIADMDHHLPKSIFVLWSDSLYNLIPSCKVCNMLFKGKRYIEFFNPFERGYDEDAYFLAYDNKKIRLNDIFGWNKAEICLCFNEKSEAYSKIKEEAELFHIEDVYQIHNEFVTQLLYKKNIISKSITTEVIDFINKQVLNVSISVKDVELLLYGMDLEKVDFNKTPLSKLTYDIVKR